MTREARSPVHIRPRHVVVYGGLSLLALRTAWVEHGSGWGRWSPLVAMVVAFSLLLAGWLTEGRHRPRWFHWLMTREPLRPRTQLLLMVAFVQLGFFAVLLVPVHPPVVNR